MGENCSTGLILPEATDAVTQAFVFSFWLKE
jgi:hypothetical protein